jgi:hypothetical protein
MTMEERIKAAAVDAELAFWASVAAAFPEATDGSFDPPELAHLNDEFKGAVESWVMFNILEEEDE